MVYSEPACTLAGEAAHRLICWTVISQSGYFVPSAAFNRSAIYEETFQTLLRETSCSDLDCLKTLPLDVFNDAAYEAIDFAILAARVYGIKVQSNLLLLCLLTDP